MPAIALLTDNRKLLGFLLVAQDDPLLPGMQYDCVLTGFPRNADLYGTPLCTVIQEHKHIEFVLCTSEQHLAIDLTDGWEIRLSLADDGAGPWSAQHTDGTLLTGQCEIATGEE
jgi:hypothetical protein